MVSLFRLARFLDQTEQSLALHTIRTDTLIKDTAQSSDSLNPSLSSSHPPIHLICFSFQLDLPPPQRQMECVARNLFFSNLSAGWSRGTRLIRHIFSSFIMSPDASGYLRGHRDESLTFHFRKLHRERSNVFVSQRETCSSLCFLWTVYFDPAIMAINLNYSNFFVLFLFLLANLTCCHSFEQNTESVSNDIGKLCPSTCENCVFSFACSSLCLHRISSRWST